MHKLPVHFFTIVLNGEPFIRHHIEVFKHIPFRWHWHIIEGVAALKHDTAWSLQFGARITDDIHRHGLSNDGTTEYLDGLKKQFPENITIYRKKDGAFWDGKLEMVNTPLEHINGECLLWQVDADELWTVEQICAGYAMFMQQPEKTAAFYYCHYFVGEDLVITTRDTYGNNTGYEWLRTWRYRPGDRWMAHEPPRLCREMERGKWVDLSVINVSSHMETEARHLVFQHYAYATEAQLFFKERYFGYAGAVGQWKRLQEQEQFPVMLRDYFGWVNDSAQVDTAAAQGIRPVALKNVLGQWRFRQFDPPSNEPANILWVRTDSIGDAVLASSMLSHIREKFKHAKITVLCQETSEDIYRSCPFIDDIVTFNRIRAYQDEKYRNGILTRIHGLNADISINSVYSREPLNDFFAIGSNAKERIAMHGNLSNMTAEIRDQNNRGYTQLLQSLGENKPEMERHKDFLKGMGINVPHLEPVVWITPEDEAFAEDFFRENSLNPEKTIAIFAGVQNDVRIYEHYGTAIAEICKDNQFTLVALGAKSDQLINQIALDATGARTFNLSGKTTLRQTAAIVKRCLLAVGAETGLAHIACAVGTTNVILLGGGYFGRFMPYSSLTSVVCLPLDCYCCEWRCRYQRVHCIRDVSPAVLEEAIRQTLHKSSGKPRVFVQGQSMWKPSSNQPGWQWFDRFIDMHSVEIIPVGTVPIIPNAASQPDKNILPAVKIQESGPSDKPEEPLFEQIEHSDTHESAKIKVSAIVSTYNSERFMKGCLEDLVNQTLYKRGELEIIVIDSGSQQNEKSVVKEFQKTYPNIQYIRTENRETVYAAWNRSIKLASGKYITNANTDDRHRKDALEVMAGILDLQPDIGLIYADAVITEKENETFDKHTPAGHCRWIDYSREDLSIGCFIGPQPVWRKSLHDKYGYFDESFASSGDWEFWLRISEGTEFFHIPELMGLYFKSSNNLEHQNEGLRIKEDRIIYKRYIMKYLPRFREYFAGISDSGLSDPVRVYRFGQILAALDKYDEAISLYALFLQHNPGHRGFHSLLEDLKKLKAPSKPAESAGNYGSPAGGRDDGDFDTAVRNFEEVLRSGSYDRSVILAYGELLVRFRKFSKAKEILEPYLKTNPDDSEANALLQKCQAVLGKVNRLSQAAQKVK